MEAKPVSEISTGIRSHLAWPGVYDAFVAVAGGNKGIYFQILQDIAGTFAKPKVLDVGCGTGRVLRFLPENVDYRGYDLNPEYIDSANHTLGHRGRFFCADAASVPTAERNFDLVTAFGLLHHLDDAKSLKVFELAYDCLAHGGYLITADGVYCEEQPMLARVVVSLDRGQHVRWPNEYQALARSKFSKVTATLAHRRFLLPHTSYTMVCQKEPLQPPLDSHNGIVLGIASTIVTFSRRVM